MIERAFPVAKSSEERDKAAPYSVCDKNSKVVRSRIGPTKPKTGMSHKNLGFSSLEKTNLIDKKISKEKIIEPLLSVSNNDIKDINIPDRNNFLVFFITPKPIKLRLSRIPKTAP